MRDTLLVAIGGGCGAVLRLRLGGIVLHHSANLKFPLSTFIVNIVGCLLIGLCGAFLARHEGFGLAWKSFIMTGVLGGFTTFSAFGFETAYLIRDQQLGVACAYAISSVLAGTLAVFLGLWIAR